MNTFGTKLVIDIDNVLYPTTDKVVSLYNFYYNRNILFEDVTEYEGDKIFGEEFINCFQHPDLYSVMKPYPYAVKVIKKLNQMYEILICTNKFRDTYRNKVAVLNRDFPFIKDSQIREVSSKGELNGDILIDDSVNNHRAFNKSNNVLLNIIMDKPYNRFVDFPHCRVRDWVDISMLLGIDLIPNIMEISQSTKIFKNR